MNNNNQEQGKNETARGRGRPAIVWTPEQRETLQMHVLMAVAEFEKSIIQERTLAGLEVAKIRLAKIGRKLGRVRREWTVAEREVIESWEGTVTGLAKALGCSVGTAHATLKRCLPVVEA